LCQTLSAKVERPEFLLITSLQEKSNSGKNISNFIKSKINEELKKEWGIK